MTKGGFRDADRNTGSVEQQTRRRATYLTGLLWHAGAFLIINAFFWLMDLLIGAGGIQWSVWITAFWGFALAFHALAYWVDGRGLEERKIRQFMKEQGQG